MTRLTDPISLRTAAALAEYQEIAALPWVYGIVTLSPVPYDTSGRRWLLADHPIGGVDRVELSGARISTWALRQAVDVTGRPVAVLETQAQVASGGDLRVTLRGAVHPGTGEALSRPDLIIWDIARRSGYTLDPARLDELRAQCQTDGLQVGGVIADTGLSIQGAIDTLCAGAGLAWSREARDIGMLWPRDTGDPVASITHAAAPDLTARWSADDLCTALEVAYDYDWSRGEYRSVLNLRAPAAVERYGEIPRRVQAGWLHDARAALAYGRRHLQHHARPLWEITVRGPRGLADVGDTVAIDHPYSPVAAAVLVEQVESDPDSDYVLLAPAGDAPEIALSGAAGVVDPDAILGPVYESTPDGVTWLITDDAGQPLPGARVQLDSGAVAYTDRLGYVRFDAVAPGRHTLDVTAAGHEPQRYEVTVA